MKSYELLLLLGFLSLGSLAFFRLVAFSGEGMTVSFILLVIFMVSVVMYFIRYEKTEKEQDKKIQEEIRRLNNGEKTKRG